MPIIELRKPSVNLWEEYPDLDLISEFKKLREDEGDERSNNILKAIYYIWDPKSDKRDSGFSETELIKEITKNLIGGKKFDWTKYEKVRQAWFTYCLTKTDVLLKQYEDEIEGLNTMLKNWIWNQDTATQKAAAMGALKTLWEQYKEVKKDFTNEKQARAEMMGGYQITLIEEYAEAD